MRKKIWILAIHKGGIAMNKMPVFIFQKEGAIFQKEGAIFQY